MTQSVGIIGHGYVGNAVREFFSKHYKVSVYDPAQGLADKDAVSKSDLALICLPTNSKSDMRCDVSLVEEAVLWCEADIIVIKSTVEPGTTDRLVDQTGKRIVFSPEYCGESSYWSPYKWDRKLEEMPFFTFGGNPIDTSAVVDAYMTVVGPTKKFVQTSAKNAEMAKYMENAFYASKIAFVYEMNEICLSAGVDYNSVRELWLMDPRINPMHTAVFHQNEAPFGGKCLPKDLAALVAYAKQLGYSPDFLQEVADSNARIGARRRQRSSDALSRKTKSPSCGDSIG